MIRCRLIGAILGLLLSVGLVSAGEPERISSLREAERLALERNLDLQAQTAETRGSEARRRGSYGLYDPVFASSLAEGETRDPVSSSDPSGLLGLVVSAREFEYRRFDFSLTQKVPTGAELVLSFDNMRQRSLSTPRPAIDPSYESELRLSLVQPLLKGFGRTVTEEQILLATRDRDISLQDLRERAFELLRQTRDAYYEILRRRDSLDYRKVSVELARKVLEENRARVKVGVLAPIEELEAEVGLKTRERELLDAQRAYDDAVDSLAVLVQATGSLEVVGDELGIHEIEVDETAGFQSALTERPDLLRRLQAIERLEIERRVARNNLLPSVDLVAGYGQKGFGEEYDDDLDLMMQEDLRNWEIGVNLSYPLGNRSARGDYLRVNQQKQAELARVGQLREEIRKEIRAASRSLQVSANKIEVAGRGRDLSEEKLRTLLKRKDVGLATTRDVLEGEEDLARARTDQIDALVEYNNAVTEYLRVTGQLLRHEDVSFTGPIDPEGEGGLLKLKLP